MKFDRAMEHARAAGALLLLVAAVTASLQPSKKTEPAKPAAAAKPAVAALAAGPTSSPETLAASCAALSHAGIVQADGAAVHVAPEFVKGRSATVPYRCHVTGSLAPQMSFELQLPLPVDGFTGRYVQIAGDCACAPQNLQGHDTAGCAAADDPGIPTGWTRSGGQDAESIHRTAAAARAITAAFYGKPFNQGTLSVCSGKEDDAREELRRFPGDFDRMVTRP